MGNEPRSHCGRRRSIQHPAAKHINNLNYVTFWHEPTIEGALYKNVHVFSAGHDSTFRTWGADWD